jgi:hypothetical protein
MHQVLKPIAPVDGRPTQKSMSPLNSLEATSHGPMVVLPWCCTVTGLERPRTPLDASCIFMAEDLCGAARPACSHNTGCFATS